MAETKKWYLSKGVWGAILTLAGPLLASLGVDLDESTQSLVAEKAAALAGAVATVIGGVLALWGRLSASTAIGND